MLKNHARTFLAGAAGMALIAWAVAATISFAPRTAQARPIYAQRTGLVANAILIRRAGGRGQRLAGPSRRTATGCPADRGAATGLSPDRITVPDTAMARE